MTDTDAALVIGADGVLGRSIADQLRGLGQRVIETRRRPADGSAVLDISTMATSWRPPANAACAYFCAGVTSQHECRVAFDRAHAVNVTATVTLIRRLVDAGIFVVFPSTNLVFDGRRPRVSAAAAACPRTAYGRMKAEAEACLLRVGAGVGVVRLTKVVHGRLPVFTQWRTALAQGRDVHPFNDMVFAPLPLHRVVSVLIAVAESRVNGIVQASSQDDISYADACHVFARDAGARVKPVSWRDSGHHFEHVPAHTTLDTARAEECCGFRPPLAHTAIEEILGSLPPLPSPG